MISILRNNEANFQLLYSSVQFATGLTVTGYLIYPDLTTSTPFTFTEKGDGIYSVIITHSQKTNSNTEKYGLVIKEDGVVKKFEIIQNQN